MYYPYRSSNPFYTLLRRAHRNQWCTNRYCSTCGAQALKFEILRIGVHFLIEEAFNYKNNHHEFNDQWVTEIKEILLDVAEDQVYKIHEYLPLLQSQLKVNQ